MPFSDVAICNLALSRIKVGYQIASLTENSQEAAACNLAYPFARDCALRDFDWPFARRFFNVSLVQMSLVIGWASSFRLPPNCLKVRRLTAGNDYPFTLGSDDTGLLLHSNCPLNNPLTTIEYTHAITDPTLFPPDFASALAWSLAADVAVSLSASKDMADTAAARYEVAVSRSYATAMNEVQNDEAPQGEFLGSR
jgi:hypothetical protein